MHPTIRVQTTQPGDPPPGTIRTDAAGELLVYLGAEVTTEQIAELAPTIRTARTVTLIAPVLETARQARRDVQRWGKPEPVRVPRMQLPPRPDRPPRERCGAPRTDGSACRAWAGTGTMSRVGPCRAHGGQAIDAAKAEELTDFALTWVELTQKARTEPLTPAEQLVSLTAARALLVARRDGVIR